MLKRYRRMSVAVCALALLLICLVPGAGGAATPTVNDDLYHGQVNETVQIPTASGVELTIDLEFPAVNGQIAPGKFPVIACLCYIGNVDTVGINFVTSGSAFARAGYVAATVRVPGSGTSEGGPWDMADPTWEKENYDAIEWLGTQPWSTGKVGTIGESGNGMSQIFTSQLRPPHLTTMIAEAATADSYDTLVPGGMLSLQIALFACGIPGAATSFTNGIPVPYLNSNGSPITAQELSYLIQMNLLKIIRGDELPFCPILDGWNSHPTRDAFWTGNPLAKIQNVTIPVWAWSGWDDIFRRDIPNFYEGVGSTDKMLTMGLNSHESPGGGDGFDQTTEALRWFDYWLKDEDTGILSQIKNQAFTYYVNNEFVWKSAPSYPIPGTSYTPLYIGKGAPLPLSQGSLSLTPPASSAADMYFYVPPSITAFTQMTDDLVNPFDPNNAQRDNGLDENLTNGDQRMFAGPGTVTYVTAPLSHDVEVTGPITATLFAKTSSPDTDFVFKLIDVYPDQPQANGVQPGFWKLVSEGNLKGKFRTYKNDYASETPIPVDQPVRYDVEGYPTSYLFKAGDRIAVTIESSEAPLLLPNLNPALVAILHSPQYPSEVTLPIIGPSAESTLDPQAPTHS